MIPLAESLMKRYREQFKRFPSWAYPLWPSIPFVGDAYEESNPKIALYASAENLTHYEIGEELPDFCQGDRAWDRHRGAFEAGWDKFFPQLHIAPVENGSLLCAALYLLQEHLGSELPETPRDLVDRLAIANVAKFSIRTDGGPNVDYAGSRRHMKASLDYFRTDLDVLKPDLLILPKSIWRQPEVTEIVESAASRPVVVPVPQFNATVVNVHLARHGDRALALEERLRETQVGRWTDQLRGYRTGYPYRYYAEIDDVFVAARSRD